MITDSSKQIKFMSVGVGEHSCTATDTSVVTSYPQKTFTRLVCKGDTSNIYDIGNGTSILEISSVMITKDIAQTSLADKFINFIYKPLSYTALLDGYLTPWGDCGTRKVTNISISLTALGAVASLSTPVISDNPYKDVLNRMINARVTEGVYYDSMHISNNNGLGFRSKSEAVVNNG